MCIKKRFLSLDGTNNLDHLLDPGKQRDKEVIAMAEKKAESLTTASGIQVADNQNSLTAGARGALLVQDWQLFENPAHFNRVRIPECIVHVKAQPLTARALQKK
jgi:Catalase